MFLSELPYYDFEILRVDGKKAWKCDVCGKLNSSYGNARRHRFAVHATVGAPKLFKCDKPSLDNPEKPCTYSSNCKTNFLEHSRRHGERIHHCDKVTFCL